MRRCCDSSGEQGMVAVERDPGIWDMAGVYYFWEREEGYGWAYGAERGRWGGEWGGDE